MMGPLAHGGAWPVIVMLTGLALLVAIVVVAVAPGPALRVILIAYPKGHPRRRELLGEVHAMGQFERPFFVFEQIELAIGEGVSLRRAARRKKTQAQGAADGWDRDQAEFLTFVSARRIHRTRRFVGLLGIFAIMALAFWLTLLLVPNVSIGGLFVGLLVRLSVFVALPVALLLGALTLRAISIAWRRGMASIRTRQAVLRVPPPP
jgi:hypothetical protein